MIEPTCPLPPERLLTDGFLEQRARLIEVAAFLDRIDRAPGGAAEDFRLVALRAALAALAAPTATADRAERLQRLFSDPTEELRESAAGLKGAYGAWPGLSAAGGR